MADEADDLELEVEEQQEEPEEEEVLTVQIGEEEPEEDEQGAAPEWVKELRRSDREKSKRIRELEEKLNGAEKKPDALGAEPTMEACDYDEAEFKAKWAKWNADKAAHEAEQKKAQETQQQQEERWNQKLAKLTEQKAALNAPDYEDAEDLVKETFSVVQQGIVVQGAENPALLAYALGKNPKRAKELAAITDPIEFAFAIAKTEAQLKVGKKNAPPPPERTVGGRLGTNSSVDNALERLREKARKTGDMSEVVAYKRKLREREKAKA